MKLNLRNPERWVTISGGGIEIEVLLMPLSHFERIRCIELMNEETRTIEKSIEPRERGMANVTRTTIAANPHAVSNVEKYMLEKAIKDWRGLEDEETGTRIEFSMENLGLVMGLYPTWADVLKHEVQKLLSIGDTSLPNPQEPTASLPSNSSGSDI